MDVWLEKELFPVMRQCFEMGGRNNHNIMMAHAINAESANIGSSYEVKVVQQLINGSDQGRHNGAQEWQKMEYRQHYCDYFMHLHPAASYQYNNQMERLAQTNDEHSNNSPLLGRVTINRRLTSKGWMQDTRHIRIHVGGCMHSDQSSPPSSSSNDERIHTLPYQAGDVASILPRNPPAMVERFLSVLPVSIRTMADDVIRIQQNSHQSLNHSWPQMCTSRGLLTHCGIFKLCPREKTSSLSSNSSHPEGQEQRDKLISH